MRQPHPVTGSVCGGTLQGPVTTPLTPTLLATGGHSEGLSRRAPDSLSARPRDRDGWAAFPRSRGRPGQHG